MVLKILKQIQKVGIITEASPCTDKALQDVGVHLQKNILKRFSRSLAIRAVDAGSCNGCELEMHALLNPYYNIASLGIDFVASPRHADLLLVTGPVAKNMVEALQCTYDAMPEPKLVVALGDCATCGGIYGESYASCGQINNIIPVDVTIPGCAPSPTQILQGILQAILVK